MNIIEVIDIFNKKIFFDIKQLTCIMETTIQNPKQEFTKDLINVYEISLSNSKTFIVTKETLETFLKSSN